MEVDQLNPVDLNLINDLWVPNVFIYNLKTFKVKPVYNEEFYPLQIQDCTTVVYFGQPTGAPHAVPWSKSFCSVLKQDMKYCLCSFKEIKQ